MFISKRRLQWGVILGLAIVLLFLLRPSRSWIDQSVVQYLIDQDVSVQRVLFHQKQSVMEVRDLAWHRPHGDRVVRAHAERAWLAVDAEPLIDRQIVIPKVQMEEVVLSIDALDQQPVVRASVWQQELARRVVGLNWSDVQKHFSSLLAAEDINRTWSDRVDRWIRRSHEIVNQVAVLDQDVRQETNPLRAEQKLQAELRSVDEWSREQELLLGQFDTIQKLLKSECKRLQERFDDELANALNAGDQPGMTGQQAAEAMIDEVLLGCWLEYRDYLEATDALAQATSVSANNASYDYDFNDQSVPLLDLKKVNLAGKFYLQQEAVPFSVDGNYRIVQSVDQGKVIEGTWDCEFDHPVSKVNVSVAESDSKVVLQLSASQGNGDEAPSPSDHWTMDADGESTDAEDLWVTIDVTSDQDGHIQGTLAVTAARIGQHWPAAEGTGNSLRARPGEASTIAATISGTWREPHMEVAGEGVPEWFIRAVDGELYERTKAAQTQLEQVARMKLNEQIDALQSLVVRSASEGRSVLEAHRKVLVATQNRLKSNLEEVNGTAFARRPGPTRR